MFENSWKCTLFNLNLDFLEMVFFHSAVRAVRAIYVILGFCPSQMCVCGFYYHPSAAAVMETAGECGQGPLSSMTGDISFELFH